MQSNVEAGLLANAERQSIHLLNDRLHSRPSLLPQGVCDAFGSPQTPNCSRYARTAGKCCLSCGSSSRKDRKSTRLNSSHTVIYTLSLHDALPAPTRGLRRLWIASDAELLAVRTHRRQVLLELRIVFQELQHLVQRHNAHHRNAEITFHFLNCRQLTVAALLTIQRDQHAGGLGAILGCDDLHHLTDGGTGGDHVIDDQHVALERSPNQATAFAMCLGLFAVEAPRQIQPVMFSQRHGSRGRQRDALVGWAKQNVEGNAAFNDGCRVKTTQLSQGRTRVEQACIEEVRAGAPGLQSELTEA